MRSVLLMAIILCTAAPAQAASLTVTVVDSAGRPLRDAVISVRPANTPGGAARFAFDPRVGQKDIQFTPGLTVVPVGTTVSFPNFDKVRHHVYSFSRAKKFELKLYGRDQSRSVRFDVPGTIALGCNIHDGMRGFIRVVDTPWAAASDARGRASFNGLPAGGAQLVIWHPAARSRDNEIRTSVAIDAGAVARTIKLPVAP